MPESNIRWQFGPIWRNLEDEEAKTAVMEEMKQGHAARIMKDALEISRLRREHDELTGKMTAEKKQLKRKVKKEKRKLMKVITYDFKKLIEAIRGQITIHRFRHGENTQPIKKHMSPTVWRTLTQLFETTHNFDDSMQVLRKYNSVVYVITRDQLAEITPGGLDYYRKVKSSLIIGPTITFDFCEKGRKTFPLYVSFTVNSEDRNVAPGSLLRFGGIP